MGVDLEQRQHLGARVSLVRGFILRTKNRIGEPSQEENDQDSVCEEPASSGERNLNVHDDRPHRNQHAKKGGANWTDRKARRERTLGRLCGSDHKKLTPWERLTFVTDSSIIVMKISTTTRAVRWSNDAGYGGVREGGSSARLMHSMVFLETNLLIANRCRIWLRSVSP